MLKDKSKFFFHNTARFPWHALVLNAIAKVLAVSGMPPVYSARHVPGPYPPGGVPPINLFLQIAVGELIALAYIKGTTSVGDANSASMDPLHTLGWACYALGGIAGCGDDRGAKEDLDKFDYLTADLKLDGTAVGRLQTELQNLANDIIRDPIVSPRHGELARSLSESRYVDRDRVEKILLPASLPDYSPRLAEIGKKFNIGGAAGQRRSFPLSELPL